MMRSSLACFRMAAFAASALVATLPAHTQRERAGEGTHVMPRQALLTARARPEEVVGGPRRRSAATATGAFVLAADAKSVAYQLTWDRLESSKVLAIDLHDFGRGAVGKVVAVLCDGEQRPCPAARGGTIQGTWPIDPHLARELAAERIYVDIHTAANRDGEVRAQVLPMPWMVHSRQYLARFNAQSERAAAGTGTFYVTPFPSGTRLTFDLTVTGLPEDDITLEVRHGELRGAVAARLQIDGEAVQRRGGTISGILEERKDPAPLSPALLRAIESENAVLTILAGGRVITSGRLVPVH